MKHFLLTTVALLLGCAEADCTREDLFGAPKGFSKLDMGLAWSSDALVCRVGDLLIAVPDDAAGERQRSFLLMDSDGFPIVSSSGESTLLYSPNPKHAAFDRPIVNVWHEEQKIERIWYQTVGRETETIVYDRNFDGQPDIKTEWKSGAIERWFIWYNDGWVPGGERCMYINDKCVPFEWKDGRAVPTPNEAMQRRQGPVGR